MELHLMIVGTSTDRPKARILMTGSRLDRFGFVPETLVSVQYQDGVLTMKAKGTGLAVYQKLVPGLRKQRGTLLQVFKWTRQKTETHLVLEGDWLEKQGFYTGDILLAGFEPGRIRMKHLELAELGFSFDDTAVYRFLTVQTSHQIPMVQVNAGWLEECGFQIGNGASLSYESGFLMVRPYESSWSKRGHGRMPAQVNVLCRRNVPQLRIAGGWLLELGYHPGKCLILECRPGQLKIRRLEDHHLHL